MVLQCLRKGQAPLQCCPSDAAQYVPPTGQFVSMPGGTVIGTQAAGVDQAIPNSATITMAKTKRASFTLVFFIQESGTDYTSAHAGKHETPAERLRRTSQQGFLAVLGDGQRPINPCTAVAGPQERRLRHWTKPATLEQATQQSATSCVYSLLPVIIRLDHLLSQ